MKKTGQEENGMKCPFCGAELDDGARFCVHCASQVDSKTDVVIKTNERGRTAAVCVATICVAVLLVFAAVFIGVSSIGQRGRTPAPQITDTEDAAVTVSTDTAGPEDTPGPDTSGESGTPTESVTADAPETAGSDITETDVTASVYDTTGPETAGTAPGVTTEEETAAVPAVTSTAATSAETAAPETKAPVTTAAETKAHVTTAPETKAPVTTAPETTVPVTTPPETAAPVTTSLETAAPAVTEPETTDPGQTVTETVTVERPGLRLATYETYAGGIPDAKDETSVEWLWDNIGYSNDWDCYAFGQMPPMYPTEEPEDFHYFQRVYFRNGGSAVASAYLYNNPTNGLDLKLLKYSINADQSDVTIDRFIAERPGGKRPDSWKGLLTENGIENELYRFDPDSGYSGVMPVSYEYWTLDLTGNEKTIRVTVEKRTCKKIPAEGYESVPDSYFYDLFTLAEYVD